MLCSSDTNTDICEKGDPKDGDESKLNNMANTFNESSDIAHNIPQLISDHKKRYKCYSEIRKRRRKPNFGKIPVIIGIIILYVMVAWYVDVINLSFDGLYSSDDTSSTIHKYTVSEDIDDDVGRVDPAVSDELRSCMYFESTGDYPKAAECYELLAYKHETAKISHSALYRIYTQLSNEVKAEEHLKAYVDLAPSDIKARIDLASIYTRLERTQEAIRHLITVTRLDKRHSYGHHQLVDLYKKDNQTELAIDLAFEYLILVPNDLKLKHKLGIIYVNSGNYPIAFDLYESLLSEEENDVIALNNYAVSLYQTEDYRRAIDLLCKAIKIVPSRVTILINLANSYEMYGDTPSALKTLLGSASEFPFDVDVKVATALIYKNLNDDESAIQWLQGAIDVNRDTAEPYILLSDMLIAKEQFEAADRYLHHAYSLEPNSPLVLYNLHTLYTYYGNRKLANLYTSISKPWRKFRVMCIR